MKNKSNLFNKFIAILLLVSLSSQNIAFAQELQRQDKPRISYNDATGNVSFIGVDPSSQDDQPTDTATVTSTPIETAVVTETPVPPEVPIPADIFDSTEIAPNTSSSSDGEVTSLSATTWYVTTTGSDSNSCTTIEFPCLTINGAIGKAADGDTIYVATGMYTSDGTEVVLIEKSVTLSGGWDASFTTRDNRSILDGQNVRRGITITGTLVVAVDHFTIQNGFGGYQGGGIYNYGGTLTLNNSIVSDNVSKMSGGGIYNSGGALTINNTTISGNSAGEFGVSGGGGGGGISNTNIGGIPSGYIILNNSTVSGNTILGYFSGSGINNSVLPFEINNSTVSGNTSDNATAESDNIGAVSINNSGIMTIKNSTVSGNSYGGINNQFGTVTLQIQNSILANNTTSGFGWECTGNISSSGYNLIGNNLGCTFIPVAGDLVGTNAIPINPVLTPLQDNGGLTLTHALMTGSPAINAGNPASPGSSSSACLATDQRGTSRPVSIACDIGAFEGQIPSVFVNISGNAGVADAILSYMDGTLKTVTADGGGNYSITVLSGWSGTVTPSKAGQYTFFTPVKRTYNNVVENQTSQNYATTLLTFLIKDPSFEAYTPNPYWAEDSTNFRTPLCTIPDCGNGGGTALPRTGSTWGWFGGAPTYERATLAQGVTIPSGFPNLKLQFYFWIGSAGAVSSTANVFTTTIDGVTVFSANATQQSSYSMYTPILVDVSAFADGNSHLIYFTSVTSGQVVTFNLDDVSLVNVTFFDVPSDYWALQFIERLYNAGITGGCSVTPLNYCPDSTVTRAQMAVFLLKGMHGSSYVPPAVGASTGFTDVATDYWAAAWIKQLAAEGITGGCGNGNYCPDATVTRAQMAVFLLKAKHGSSYLPPSATGVFTDVPVGYWADKWIEQLALEGITGGCGTGIYCPDSSVTRAQMAVFLVKAFNLP